MQLLAGDFLRVVHPKYHRLENFLPVVDDSCSAFSSRTHSIICYCDTLLQQKRVLSGAAVELVPDAIPANIPDIPVFVMLIEFFFCFKNTDLWLHLTSIVTTTVCEKVTQAFNTYFNSFLTSS